MTENKSSREQARIKNPINRQGPGELSQYPKNNRRTKARGEMLKRLTQGDKLSYPSRPFGAATVHHCPVQQSWQVFQLDSYLQLWGCFWMPLTLLACERCTGGTDQSLLAWDGGRKKRRGSGGKWGSLFLHDSSAATASCRTLVQHALSPVVAFSCSVSTFAWPFPHIVSHPCHCLCNLSVLSFFCPPPLSFSLHRSFTQWKRSI